METRKTDLFDILIIFAQKKKLIIFFTLAVAILAVIYSLVTPQIWSSQATFFTVGDNAQAVPLSLGSFTGLASSFLSTDNFTQGQNSVTIMKSRMFSEEVIRKFNLIDYFKISVPDTLRAMDMALMKLSRKVVSASIDDQTGLIELRIETKNKKLSNDIAAFYVDRLEKYNQEYKVTKGRRNRQFLEKRVEDVRYQIDTLSVALKNFQTKHKAIDLQTQMISVIDLYSDIVSQQIKNDIEIELAKDNYPANSPVLTELEQRRKVISDKISEFENSSSQLKPKYMISIESIPDLALRYAQLMMNLEIQKKVLEYVYPQYEAAKIEELKDMPTLEIVDYPREAGLRTKPHRAMLCIVATLVGFVISLVLALISDIMDKNSEKIKNLRHVIFPRK
jgi:tyrosine-protein kinase Etk/Wzc